MSHNARGMAIFDLDGTLTVPTLDFDAIRAEIGLPPGPILESLAKLSDASRTHALAILERHERAAAEDAVLYDGAAATVQTLRARDFPVAILTRNARRWTQFVMNRFGLVVDALRTRDDGVIKPSPEPVLALCAETRCDPRMSWMIGDHLIDLQSGRSAGCSTVLMIGRQPPPVYADQADHIVTALPQLLDILPPGPGLERGLETTR